MFPDKLYLYVEAEKLGKINKLQKTQLFPPKQRHSIYPELDLHIPQLWISHMSQYTAETGTLLTEGMSENTVNINSEIETLQISVKLANLRVYPNTTGSLQSEGKVQNDTI